MIAEILIILAFLVVCGALFRRAWLVYYLEHIENQGATKKVKKGKTYKFGPGAAPWW